MCLDIRKVKSMEKLKTATGKEFSCDYFNAYPQERQINIRVVGETVVRVATVFSDPNETVQLWWDGQYASMYTKVLAIVPESGAVRVVLGRE